MRRQRVPAARRSCDKGVQDRIAAFLMAVVKVGDRPSGADLQAVVNETGLSWAKAAAVAVAGRLRRDGCLASLPHGRLILSERGRAVAAQA